MQTHNAIQGWRRWTLVGLLALVSVNALGAGYAFVRAPDGSTLGIPEAWLEGTPFPDYAVPGAILLVLGLVYGYSAFREARRAEDAWFWAGLSGGAMIVWILVQAALMGYSRHPVQTTLQVTVLAIGLATGLLALSQLRSVRAASSGAAGASS